MLVGMMTEGRILHLDVVEWSLLLCASAVTGLATLFI
jgi:hypothetical protein